MKIISEPIDAIVKFKGKEKPMPYKFRYFNSENVYHEIKIDNVLKVDEIKTAGIKAFVYLCQSEIEGVVKLYELKYLISDY